MSRMESLRLTPKERQSPAYRYPARSVTGGIGGSGSIASSRSFRQLRNRAFRAGSDCGADHGLETAWPLLRLRLAAATTTSPSRRDKP